MHAEIEESELPPSLPIDADDNISNEYSYDKFKVDDNLEEISDSGCSLYNQ